MVFVLLIIDAINVALCGISYYPAEEKIQLSKEILRGYFVENDFDDVSAGFVGSSVRENFPPNYIQFRTFSTIVG